MHFSSYSPEIRFADIDAMGHVNNSVYLTYFEQARMHFFRQLIGEKWDWNKRGILVARNEISYMKPVFLQDDIVINTRCTHIGNKSFTLHYEVRRGNELCSSGISVLVCYNHALQSTEPIPVEWLDGLRKMFTENPGS